MAGTDALLGFATLAVVAALALPNWTEYSLRSRRNEALDALRVISERQEAYFEEHQRYSDSYSELGFAPRRGGRGSSVRGETYHYSLSTWEREGRPSGNYRATATGNLDPRDGVLDIIIIENELAIAGRTVDASTPIILSDDIAKATVRVISKSNGDATGYRRRDDASR